MHARVTSCATKLVVQNVVEIAATNQRAWQVRPLLSCTRSESTPLSSYSMRAGVLDDLP
jgi:hypothetical protein